MAQRTLSFEVAQKGTSLGPDEIPRMTREAPAAHFGEQ
jgi:hypothetical protein